METQKCIRCGETKPLSDYYKHPQMANGHLGRCKECHRLEMARNRTENIDRIRAYDRGRNSRPERKRQNQIKNKKKAKKEGPLYTAAHNAVSRAIRNGTLIRPENCDRCGVKCKPNAHHDDYARFLDVMFLCPICHAQRHKELNRLRTTETMSTEKQQDEIIDSDEFARRYSLNQGTPAVWRARKLGPKFVKLGRAVRYRVSDIEDWINSSHTTPQDNQ